MRLSAVDRRSNSVPDYVTFELARKRDDFESALRLIHDSYVRSGLTVGNPAGIRITPYHLLDTTEVFVAKARGTVFMTISLIGDGELGLPMESMYGSEIEQLRTCGKRIAELACFADRRADGVPFSPAFNALTKLIAQTARYRTYDTVVAAVHPRHAKVYRRLLGFGDFGGLAYCQYASNRPAVALLLDLMQQHGTKHYEALATDPVAMEALQPRAFDSETRQYFQNLLDVTLVQFNNAELEAAARSIDRQQIQQA